MIATSTDIYEQCNDIDCINVFHADKALRDLGKRSMTHGSLEDTYKL